MKYSTPAAASSSTRANEVVGGAHVAARGSSPVTWRRKSFVAVRLLVAAAVSTSVLSRLTVTSEGSRPIAVAVAAQDLDLVRDRGGVADDVGHVGVARHEPQRPLLPATTDEDRRPTRLHGRRHVAGFVDPVVAAVEATASPR